MLELLDAGIITQFLGNDLDGTSYRDISDKIKIISV
jgi:hypothetical protein